MPLRGSVDHAQGPPHASAEIARGSSFTRNGSEHLKKRNSSVRNSSLGDARGMLQQHPGSQLQTIRASTSLGQHMLTSFQSSCNVQTASSILHCEQASSFARLSCVRRYCKAVL